MAYNGAESARADPSNRGEIKACRDPGPALLQS